MFNAEVILDSEAEDTGCRVTTMKLRYPKFVHGEFMTHRVFSRNASSSRAIPVKKMIEEARSDELRAAPIFWGANRPGMVAVEELTGDGLSSAKDQWREAAHDAAERAEMMAALSMHKQVVNRILEPFLHINVIVTATEWANFFALRLAPDAQPEMHELARHMFEAYKASTPTPLAFNQWHLPFVRNVDGEVFKDPSHFTDLIAISVARCARVSYESFETGRISSINEDLELAARLRSSGHMSPFEHQCTPDGVFLDDFGPPVFKQPHLHGNLTGFIQYRKMIADEAVAKMPEGYTL